LLALALSLLPSGLLLVAFAFALASLTLPSMVFAVLLDLRLSVSSAFFMVPVELMLLSFSSIRPEVPQTRPEEMAGK